MNERERFPFGEKIVCGRMEPRKRRKKVKIIFFMLAVLIIYFEKQNFFKQVLKYSNKAALWKMKYKGAIEAKQAILRIDKKNT